MKIDVGTIVGSLWRGFRDQDLRYGESRETHT